MIYVCFNPFVAYRFCPIYRRDNYLLISKYFMNEIFVLKDAKKIRSRNTIHNILSIIWLVRVAVTQLLTGSLPFPFR